MKNKKTEGGEEGDVRMFAPVVLPFIPQRLRVQSAEMAGQHCACPDCAVAWIVSMAMDLHEGNEGQTQLTVYALATALAAFWEEFIQKDIAKGEDQNDATLISILEQGLAACREKKAAKVDLKARMN